MSHDTATAKVAYARASAGALSAPGGLQGSTTNAPDFVVRADTHAGNGWMLGAPLLYDLKSGQAGVIAVSRYFGASGYGANRSEAEASLLESLVDLLESLSGMADASLDHSAKALRDALSKQLCRAS